MYHPIQKRKAIVKLRKKGKSIPEIMDILSLAKTTVWYHVSDIRLNEYQVGLIRSKNHSSRVRKEKLIAQADSEAKMHLNSKIREEVLILAMLYWAEGSKGSCVFTNSDPRMMVLFKDLIVKVFKISEDRLDFSIRTHSSMDARISMEFWSKALNIQKNSLRLYHGDLKRRGKSEYGLCRLTVRKGAYILKVLTKIIDQICPRSLMDRTRVS